MSELDNPETLEGLIAYILTFERTIFVRSAGKAVSLSELPIEDKAGWIARWIEEGTIPVRVRSDDEIHTEKETP